MDDRSEDTAAEPLPTPAALKTRLEALAARRGFLLPHHGALAAGAPAVHAAYLAMYDALTVAPRCLSPLARESVWLAILVAVEERVGTHHLELFRQAGGSDAEAEALIGLAGHAGSLAAFRFAADSWGAHLAGLDPAAAYDRSVAALRGPLDPGLTELALLAVQAVRGDSAAIAHHLRGAYALAVPETEIVEALSYVIWPSGVNCFLEACEVWHHLMVDGTVAPSPLFAVWRDLPGQGAYDTAGGTRVSGFQGPSDADAPRDGESDGSD